MNEFLKSFFGVDEAGTPVALTFEQLNEKLTAGGVKLANLADGGYVSKDKFDAKDTELSGVKDQLTAANETIQSYKDMDIEGIKQSAADWETRYNTDTAALNQKLEQQAREHSLDMFMSGYDFTSKAAAAGIRQAVIEKDFPFEEGSYKGAKEFVDGLRTDDDYKAAFKVVETPAPENQDTGKPKFTAGPDKTPAPPAKKHLMELMVHANEHPNDPINFD